MSNISVSVNGIFGLLLEDDEKTGAKAGAACLKFPDETLIVPCHYTDPVYFSALVLWAYFCGRDCLKYSECETLPLYVRQFLEGFKLFPFIFDRESFSVDNGPIQ